MSSDAALRVAPRDRLLGELLLDAGLVGAADLERGLALQQKIGGRIGSVLMRIGAVSEDNLLQVLSRQLGLPVLGADVPAPDLHAGTLQERRHILGHGCGDEHLLAVDDVGGQAPAPPGVELGEDIVEHEDRVVVEVAPQEPEGREPQREGERPRLPVRGIALRRQRPEREEQVDFTDCYYNSNLVVIIKK